MNASAPLRKDVVTKIEEVFKISRKVETAKDSMTYIKKTSTTNSIGFGRRRLAEKKT